MGLLSQQGGRADHPADSPRPRELRARAAQAAGTLRPVPARPLRHGAEDAFRHQAAGGGRVTERGVDSMFLLRAIAVWLVIVFAESVHGPLRGLFLRPSAGAFRSR